MHAVKNILTDALTNCLTVLHVQSIRDYFIVSIDLMWVLTTLILIINLQVPGIPLSER